MRPVTWALSIVMVLLDVAWLTFTVRMWVLRHKWEIKQRMPEVVYFSQLVGIAVSNSVLLHWLLLSDGKTFPCLATQVASYIAFTYMGVPALLRMVAVVVVYFREYRAKYGRFVKRKVLLGAWAVSAVALTVRGWTFYGSRSAHYSSNARECFFIDDHILQGTALTFGAVPAMLLVRKLVQVHDAFQLRQELLWMMGSIFALVGTAQTIQVLVIWGALPDSREVHVATEVLFLLIGFCPAPWSLIWPIAKYQGWVGGVRKYYVVPVEDRTGSTKRALPPAAYGVIDIARDGGTPVELFGEFCEKQMCSESWDFVLVAVQYEMGLDALLDSDEQHQFNAFIGILDQFLTASSIYEINISAATRSRLAVFRSREIFFALDEEARRTILREPLQEIVLMLEQNLLNKFTQKYSGGHSLAPTVP